VKRNGIKIDNVNIKKSVVKQRVDNNNTWTEIPFEEFFDCECKGRNHILPNCNIYKRRMYKKLKKEKDKFINMNERNSKVAYDRLKRSCKPDYIIYYWVKCL